VLEVLHWEEGENNEFSVRGGTRIGMALGSAIGEMDAFARKA